MATAAEIRDARGHRYVSNLTALGYDDLQIMWEIQRHWPGTSWASARAVVDSTRKAELGAWELSHGPSHTPLRASETHRPDPGRTGWRYHTVVEVINDVTGVGGWVPVEIRSAVSLSRDQLEAQVREAIAANTPRTTSPKRWMEENAPLLVGAVAILVAERATL